MLLNQYIVETIISYNFNVIEYTIWNLLLSEDSITTIVDDNDNNDIPSIIMT